MEPENTEYPAFLTTLAQTDEEIPIEIVDDDALSAFLAESPVNPQSPNMQVSATPSCDFIPCAQPDPSAAQGEKRSLNFLHSEDIEPLQKKHLVSAKPQIVDAARDQMVNRIFGDLKTNAEALVRRGEFARARSEIIQCCEKYDEIVVADFSKWCREILAGDDTYIKRTLGIAPSPALLTTRTSAHYNDIKKWYEYITEMLNMWMVHYPAGRKVFIRTPRVEAFASIVKKTFSTRYTWTEMNEGDFVALLKHKENRLVIPSQDSIDAEKFLRDKIAASREDLKATSLDQVPDNCKKVFEQIKKEIVASERAFAQRMKLRQEGKDENPDEELKLVTFSGLSLDEIKAKIVWHTVYEDIGKAWLEAPNRRTVNIIEWNPTTLGHPHPDGHVLNLFNGIEIERPLALSYPDEDMRILTRWLNHIFVTWYNCDAEMFVYCLKVIANMIQNRRKIPAMIIVSGTEGCGKSGFVDYVLKGIVGAEYFHKTQNTEDIVNTFNSAFDKKLLISLEEVDLGESRVVEGLKNMVSSHELPITVKRQDTVTKSSHFLIFAFSNTKGANIHSSCKARRWFITWAEGVEPLQAKLGETDTEYMLELFGGEENSDKQNRYLDCVRLAFAKFLYSIDLDGFHPSEMPQRQVLAERKIESLQKSKTKGDIWKWVWIQLISHDTYHISLMGDKKKWDEDGEHAGWIAEPNLKFAAQIELAGDEPALKIVNSSRFLRVFLESIEAWLPTPPLGPLGKRSRTKTVPSPLSPTPINYIYCGRLKEMRDYCEKNLPGASTAWLSEDERLELDVPSQVENFPMIKLMENYPHPGWWLTEMKDKKGRPLLQLKPFQAGVISSPLEERIEILARKVLEPKDYEQFKTGGTKKVEIDWSTATRLV